VSLPQALGLLEDLTVRENVALPVRLWLGRRRTGEGRTEELLGLFGLAELADRSPSELVATHDPDALEFADRVLHLADGELTEREL
jgi:ABC-type lipoprotein export system ATPase subunit